MFSTKLNKYKISGINQEEYHVIKKEVFGYNTYYFDIKNSNPVIIDLGSHIGITVLYFKDIYPNSKIIAYEPNPLIFKYLEENIFVNNLKDVELHNLAISDKAGGFPLFIDTSEAQWYSTGGYLLGGWSGKQTTKEIQAKSITLSSILNQKIDILKMDIEGLELKVLQESKEFLNNVDNIVVEYHPGNKAKFKKLFSLLSKFFKVEVIQDGKVIANYNENNLLILKGTKLNS